MILSSSHFSALLDLNRHTDSLHMLNFLPSMPIKESESLYDS